MGEITLVNQAENSSSNAMSCTVTLNNCTTGNTLILAYSVRGDGNICTLPSGWETIGGGNVVSDASDTRQKVFFAKKNVDSASEVVTLTQNSSVASGSMRIYMVLGEFSGDFSIIMRDDMAKFGSSYYTVDCAKSSANDVILYATSSAYYLNSGGRNQSCTPSDLTKLQGNYDAERLACWFDNGNGAVNHSFMTCNDRDSSRDAIVECIQFIPKVNKYLVRNNETIYTVQNDTLVEVAGILSAEMFQSYGAEVIPAGTLLMTLDNPEVLCWKDSDIVPKLKAAVQGVPDGAHYIISDNIRIGHSSVYGITSVEALASEGATFQLSFDGGEWMIYDTASETFVASDEAMTATELVAIPTNVWSSVVNSATYMRLKAILDGTDTVTQIKFNFDNESPVEAVVESEG